MANFRVTLKFLPEKGSPETREWERDEFVFYVSAPHSAAALDRARQEVVDRGGFTDAEVKAIKELVLYYDLALDTHPAQE